MQGIGIRKWRKRWAPDLEVACRKVFWNLPHRVLHSIAILNCDGWALRSLEINMALALKLLLSRIWVFYINGDSLVSLRAEHWQCSSCQSLEKTPHSIVFSCATLTMKTLRIFIAVCNGVLIVSLEEQCSNYLEISANPQFWDLWLTLEQWVTTLMQPQKLLNGWIRATLLPCIQGILK